jgi:hypothetical protein
MQRAGILLLLLLTAPTLLGCAMCCGVDDENYGAYGGIWQRHDMQHGRVGSILSPAGNTVVADEYIVDHGELVGPGEVTIEP